MMLVLSYPYIGVGAMADRAIELINDEKLRKKLVKGLLRKLESGMKFRWLRLRYWT